MTRKNITSNSEFEEKIAYSRAVVDGDYVFMSGTTGYDYKTMTISDDVVVQTEQCFKNIEQALSEAGSSFKVRADKKDTSFAKSIFFISADFKCTFRRQRFWVMLNRHSAHGFAVITDSIMCIRF